MRLLFFTFFLSLNAFLGVAQKQKIWLDADSGNEMDDIWAEVRLFLEKDKYDIVGFSSAHFNNVDLLKFEKWNQYDTRGIETVQISQKVNEELLNALNLTNIPHPLGADRQMGRAWGEYTPRPSAATTALMDVIKNLKPHEKLDIITLGAITNIASLIAMDTTIKRKIRVFSLGGAYSFSKKAWNKNEFNVRCDLNAYDFMLNQSNLDWTLLSTDVIKPYVFKKDEVYRRFRESVPAEKVMKQRWHETNPNDDSRVLWDLGLVQLYLKPSLGRFIKVKTPPENKPNMVKMYQALNFKALYDDFWGSLANQE